MQRTKTVYCEVKFCQFHREALLPSEVNWQ